MVTTVRVFRESKGLKQEDFAAIIHTSKVNYSKKEKGSVKFSLNEARAISNNFGESIEQIFFAHEVSKNETREKGNKRCTEIRYEKR